MVSHFRSEVGGTTSQVWVGGYPISGLGGIPSQVWIGGTPFQVWVGGYPISGPGIPHVWGYPISGVPHVQGDTPSQEDTPCLGGTPYLGVPMSGVGVSHVWWVGVPISGPPIAQSSIVSTCYMAGCVPLAFTQEDFLVFVSFLLTYPRNQDLCFLCSNYRSNVKTMMFCLCWLYFSTSELRFYHFKFNFT